MIHDGIVSSVHSCLLKLFPPQNAELRNDHKDITEQINQNIQVLHSARLASGPSPQDSGIYSSM